ncbi:hypothetical protein, partial [Massilia sp. AB1]|uniref:hypothetical protein n=1 Tax=Massilia sp. AB1 TaxID=2823371 RepID=UPI001B8433C9
RALNTPGSLARHASSLVVDPGFQARFPCVRTSIQCKLPTSSKTLVRQTDGVAAGATLRLKILVSVVRFRPGPPRTCSSSLPRRQPMQVALSFPKLTIRVALLVTSERCWRLAGVAV